MSISGPREVLQDERVHGVSIDKTACIYLVNSLNKHRAGLHESEFASPDEVRCFRSEVGVQRYDVAAGEELVKRDISANKEMKRKEPVCANTTGKVR